MTQIKAALENSLKGAKRIAILGIGSDLRADDAAGMLIAEALQKKIKDSKRFKVFAGATAPENLTGEIKRFEPSHMIIVDTAEMGEKPGTILFLDPSQVGGGATFSTHKMPARILVDYLLASFKCEITIIGIQPATIEVGKNLSKAVKDSVKGITSAIGSVIKKVLL